MPGPIEHVVVLMLENRSFDHMLGYQPLSDAELVPKGASNPSSLGWGGHSSGVVRASVGASYVTDPSPGHEFDDVTLQLFCQHVAPVPPSPRNTGFVISYSLVLGSDGLPVGLRVGERAMQCFEPERLPVLSKLAQNFTVCDHWFSSVPGPTWPNRFFVHAATSNGHVDSPSGIEAVKDEIGLSAYGMRTIYESLEAAGRSWKIYYHDFPQALALTHLHRMEDAFARFEHFLEAAHSGKLPEYSFIEPRYFDIPGAPPANDMHPPHRVQEGERLIAEVYDALAAHEAAWRNTLLIVLFDEHGGFYDHVPPPACVNPDGRVAANGFAFDRLGPRVPAILISPRMKKTVCKRIFDHTSILATVKRIFDLPAFLTRRDAKAATFDDLVQKRARPSASLPRNLAALLAADGSPRVESDAVPLSPYQRSLLQLESAISEEAHTEGTAGLHVSKQAEAFLARKKS